MVQHAETCRSPGGMHWKILKVWRFRGIRQNWGYSSVARNELLRTQNCMRTLAVVHPECSCNTVRQFTTVGFFPWWIPIWIPHGESQTDSVGGRVESTDQCLLAAWLTMVLSPWFAGHGHLSVSVLICCFHGHKGLVKLEQPTWNHGNFYCPYIEEFTEFAVNFPTKNFEAELVAARTSRDPLQS